MQALVDDEPLLVIDKILEAGGKSVRGKDGVTLDIQKILKLPNDDLRIVVAMDRLPGLNNMMFGGGNIRIQARNALMGNEPPAPGFQYSAAVRRSRQVLYAGASLDAKPHD